MVKLPEYVSAVLEKLLEDMKSREAISGIGLFGSRSRGDADASSDVDLLVIDKRNLDYEYVERAEIDNLFLDLDYVPQKWILQRVPPDVDQKLFETHILFDRDRTLAKAKDLMSKIYGKSERVEIRTENYVMEADTYLSRARSALTKEDFQSTRVYAVLGLEAMMKVLLEINRLPISNSRFITALETSARKLDMYRIYEDFVGTAKLSRSDRSKTEKMWSSFLAMWKEAIGFISANSSISKTLHVRIRNNLDYYGKESFLRGVASRTRQLMDEGLFNEVAHYMSRMSVEMLENYMWLVSSKEGNRFDYTILFQQLRESRISPKEIYQKSIETLGLERITSHEAEESLNRMKEDIVSIRQKRKELISTHLES